MINYNLTSLLMYFILIQLLIMHIAQLYYYENAILFVLIFI